MSFLKMGSPLVLRRINISAWAAERTLTLFSAEAPPVRSDGTHYPLGE
jgi:hypothetical protein